jgi:ribose-phosphate pyrophosphokinase
MSTELSDVLIVGNSSDDPFAIDVAFAMGQVEDISDIISLKTFANSEFCPRFISDEGDFESMGSKLEGKTIVIASVSNHLVSRQNLAMRNLLIARAAKENGASAVILVEPDLFYSAQDRGARVGLGETLKTRDARDVKKFDGQPFTAQLYAQLLKLAGIDRVITVHNHSYAVQRIFDEVFEGQFHNLIPYDIYVDYLHNSNIIRFENKGEGLVLCAPDAGAREFVEAMYERLGLPNAKLVLMDKDRVGEREVEITLHRESKTTLADIAGHDIVLFDDMVRTGSTVVKSFQFLKQIDPGRTVFAVSHFYASDEGREKMADHAIDEILTLNTLPTVQNRDVQGRLRKKMVVLKIEKWLARNLCEILGMSVPNEGGLYQIEMSSKNPRFTRKIWSSDQLDALRAERIEPRTT